MFVRAALYLDFDNLFSGLAEHSTIESMRFAHSPSVWLTNLATRKPIDGPRRWLVRRCYLNPNGHRQDALLPTGHTDDFGLFREDHVNAGFEVIDCPTLTNQGKNAADIRLVVDAMAALHGPLHYDEFVIASCDADLTPLLHQIRAHDRRITMLAPHHVAPAYRNLADQVFEYRDIIRLLDRDNATTPPPPNPSPTPQAPAFIAPLPPEADPWGRFQELVTTELQQAPAGSLHLSTLSLKLRPNLPDHVTANWFGYKTLSNAITALQLPGVELDRHRVTTNGITPTTP